MTPESISLYFSEGSSDKEYHAELAAKDGGFVVNFRYGRRGAALTSGTKTAEPVAYAKAKSVYDKLVSEKVKKGYSPGESGSAYQATSLEERFTGIVPQLLNAIEEPELYVFFLDHDYVVQEKFDGKRCLIRKQAQSVEGINRRGLVVALPKAIEQEALRLAASSAVLDGELVGEVLHVFDLLEDGNGDARSEGYGDRFARLQKLVDSTFRQIRVVPTAHGSEAKRALFDQVKAKRGEGVVFKQIDAPYKAGRPNSGGAQLKYKLTATATCRVAKRNGSKRSVGLELADGDRWVGIGNVTIPVSSQVPAVGALVDVGYLYAYKAGSLFQPVYQGERDDLTADAAALTQLKYKPESTEEDEG